MFIGILLSIISFLPPVNYEMSLAGNFGEPRAHHFHGGIDIKTERVENKPVFSVGSGYVSRVVIGKYGYGKAVYVKHPEGYTSMFCHLNAFCPKIENIVRERQRASKNYNVDIALAPYECPVAKGQVIAISGNTGSSTAPHIHMEMYESESGDMVDPLMFFGKYIKDTTPPLAHGIMVYPQVGGGVFCGSTRKQSFSLSALNIAGKYTAWGKIGFGIWANDYMDNTYNRLGVRKTQLIVDGRLVFESDVARIPGRMTRVMDYCGDYEHFIKTGTWYMKSFVEPGNHLPIYNTDANKGYVVFDEERDYHITYVLTDASGNNTKYNFTVEGKAERNPFAVSPPRHTNLFRRVLWDRLTCISLPNVQLTVKPNSLTQDRIISPTIYRQPEKLSDRYSFNNVSLPLVRYARISIRCNKYVKDTSKLYISNSYGVSRYCGGIYKKGWLTGYIRDIGDTYEIKYDDKPPVIEPLKTGLGASSHYLRFSIYDDGSGLKQCYGYIDNRQLVLDGVSRKGVYTCDLRKYVKKNGTLHRLEVIAIDNKNNKETYTAHIKY